MSKPFIADELIPPGINDERSRALMAAFSGEIEAVDINQLLVQDALTVDERLLPAMAVARAMTDFILPGMKQELVRQLLDNYREIHANSGYIGGTRFALGLIGVSLSWLQWFNEEPKAYHDTHKVQVWFETDLFEESVVADAQHRALAIKLIEVTKRWSQDISITFGIRSTSHQYVGAFSMTGGRYTAALPADDLQSENVPVFIAALSLSAGTYTASLGEIQ